MGPQLWQRMACQVTVSPFCSLYSCRSWLAAWLLAFAFVQFSMTRSGESSPPSSTASLLLRHFPSPPAFVRPPSSRGPSRHSAHAPDTRPPGVSLERYQFYFAD